ncbi:hypothetical protein GCM10009784_08480 [Arthrobacter parietis]|uniref:Uncharacterized protein n=1 Tax=Arthrobacter parietis TaxID=271434 RepID=A0ABN3ARJ0_9MICC
MLNTGFGGGIDEGTVLIHAVLGFGAGHHEQHLTPAQRLNRGLPLGVAGLGKLRSRQIGRPRRVPNNEFLFISCAGQEAGYFAADVSG